MSNHLTELPIRIKLDERFFPSNAINEYAEITVTAQNNLQSNTYILPSSSSNGVLTNDGSGYLTWAPPVAYVIDSVEKTDALTDGTFKVIQHGSGDSSIRFTAGPVDYMIGYDNSESLFKIAKSSSLGTSDIFIMNENNLKLYKLTADTAPMLTIQQAGSGDASINLKAGIVDYALGIDVSDLINPNSFKISNSSSVGTNDVFIANLNGIKMGPSANLLNISTTEFSVGPATNIFTVNTTQTTIGPSSMTTITATGVALGPSNALQTSSTQVDIATNLVLPNTNAAGTQGVIKLGTCRMAHQDATHNTFIGELAGKFNTTGTYNIGYGEYTGSELTTGAYNTFLGHLSGEWTNTGSDNVFIGYLAGDQNENGSHNVFVGKESGYNNVGGLYNTYIGDQAGGNGISCTRNTFLGYSSGINISSSDNVVIGANAGTGYTTATRNTFIGSLTGSADPSIASIDISGDPVGSNCTFVGFGAGGASTTGIQNTFTGSFSGCSNTTGDTNDYYGFASGMYNTSGVENVAVGTKSLMNNDGGSGNVAVGTLALGTCTYQDYNIGIGQYAGRNMDGSYNIVIGTNALGAATYKAPNNCILIGGNITIADETFTNRVCIGHGSTCTVDNGFILGGASTLVGIGKNNPNQPLDVMGNVQLTGQLVLVPQASAPTPAVKGGIYFDSVAGKLKVCTNTVGPVWETISSAP